MENDQRSVWAAVWGGNSPDIDLILREEKTLRWKAIEHAVQERWGGFDNLSVVEIGSGHGSNALQFARRGATVTLLDLSDAALAGARSAADALGLRVNTVVGDIFDPGLQLHSQFDVSCSFGLCEHFLGQDRSEVVAAHLRLVKPSGLSMISVPNRWAGAYRAWMAVLKRRGSWPFGVEVPFSRSEIRRLIEEGGGQVLSTSFGSVPASVVAYVMNPILIKLERRGLRTPQLRTPLDAFGYELLAIAQRRPAAS